MRRKRAFFVLLVSLALLGVCMVYYLEQKYRTVHIPIEYSSTVMGIPVVENREILKGKHRLTVTENPGVYFENTLLPYSARENTLYLSQKAQIAQWVGKFTTEEDACLCMLQDEYLKQKDKAIEEGHAFTLWLISEDSYSEFSLVISGMPVVMISTDRKEIQRALYEDMDPDTLYFDMEDLYHGSIRVFDGGIGRNQYVITECNVEYHYKGVSTAKLEKKGYAISLRDAYDNNLDVPLLGMRADNSWKLNAMATDADRIREMTASQIWEQIDIANEAIKEPGPRMEYVELLVDNDYKGLYCLVEPIDAQKLELDDNDVLYKILDHWPFVEDDVREAIVNRWKIASPVRIRYPEYISDYEMAWYPMRDYSNKVYYSYDGFQDVEEMIYPHNAYDMFMFLMVVSGSDNYFKNMYFAADVKADGSYTMRQIPWDLDLTFGNVYDNKSSNFARFDSNVTHEYMEDSIPLLIQFCEGSYESILQQRWRKYRESFLSTEAVCQLMTKNHNYLASCGVIARENARWPEYIMNEDISYLLEFQSARMEWLDEYFGG